MTRTAQAALLAAIGLGLAIGAGAQEPPRGDSGARQRTDSGPRSGRTLCLGFGAAIAPAGGELRLDPSFSLDLASGPLSLRSRLPLEMRLGPDGPSCAMGDLEMALGLSWPFRRLRLSAGASVSAPTGRALPDERGPGAGSGYWRAAASLEAARVLDPAALAIQFEAGLSLPRPRLAARSAADFGLGLSFAEALNSELSLGLSASLGAAFDLADGAASAQPSVYAPRFSGGAGAALLWGSGRISYRAGLSIGLGDSGGSSAGPALELAVSYEAQGGKP